MQVPKPNILLYSLILVLAASAAGQNAASGRNNPYSPSPAGKATETSTTSVVKAQPVPTVASTPARIIPQQVAFVTKDNRAVVREETPRAAEPKIESAEPVVAKPSTNIYRIGVGDVIMINLKNSAQGSGFYTVRENGQIDYPLAGPAVHIANKTTDEVAAALRSSIKLFADPQVEVKVQYYLSRSFTVEGMANNPGEKVLRREAMPIFAIKAESEVLREANKARITRAKNAAVEEYLLTDAATDNVLITAGDRIEFTQEKREENAQYMFSGVKKTLVAGTRLSQAVADALGAKAEPKYAILRRVNEKGVATIAEYEIKSIRKGSVIDPVLGNGDVIEIKN